MKIVNCKEFVDKTKSKIKSNFKQKNNYIYVLKRRTRKNDENNKKKGHGKSSTKNCEKKKQ